MPPRWSFLALRLGAWLREVALELGETTARTDEGPVAEEWEEETAGRSSG